MIINLWFNKDMNQWRWTLTDPVTFDMESGQQEDLRMAMSDIANTVEYIISNNWDNKWLEKCDFKTFREGGFLVSKYKKKIFVTVGRHNAVK